MAEATEEFFESRPVPALADEGELTVITADGKGVPMVVEQTCKLLPFDDPLQASRQPEDLCRCSIRRQAQDA